ncbi:hypothetical protein HanPSC8_Chr17g0784351 [Helianthus annuus]|nr:hypothetical protein HanPSC8_Chr17g0784351 [Helianthus annuus]
MDGNYCDHRTAAELNRRDYIWADHTDTQAVYVVPTHSNHNKIKDKLEDGLEKTKVVVATGFKKIKQGSSVGFHWIKHKYQRTPINNTPLIKNFCCDFCFFCFMIDILYCKFIC